MNSFLASRHICHLLNTFANSLDLDQDRQKIGPDLGQTVWHSVFLEELFEKVNFEIVCILARSFINSIKHEQG